MSINVSSGAPSTIPGRFRGRRALGTILGVAALGLAIVTSGCERSATGPVSSDPQKLASFLIEVNTTTGEVHTTALPVPQQQGFPRPDVFLINGVLQQSNVHCQGCHDGVLGLHEITFTVTSKSVFTIHFDHAETSCPAHCTPTTTTSPPATLAPSASFDAAVDVNVTSGPTFTVAVDYYGYTTA